MGRIVISLLLDPHPLDIADHLVIKHGKLDASHHHGLLVLLERVEEWVLFKSEDGKLLEVAEEFKDLVTVSDLVLGHIQLGEHWKGSQLPAVWTNSADFVLRKVKFVKIDELIQARDD